MYEERNGLNYMEYTVHILPDNKKVIIPSGTSILETCAIAGAKIEGPCGGKGNCGRCAVEILDEGSKGYQKVLACQTSIKSDMLIRIPKAATTVHQKTRINSLQVDRYFECDSGIEKICFEVKKPSLAYQASDWERLQEALGSAVCGLNKEKTIDIGIEALRSLPAALRKGKYQVTAVLAENKVIAIEPGDTTQRKYGIAIDLGTTSVVASLLDLNKGEQLETVSSTNKQNVYGDDVISRITYCMENQHGLERLHARVVQVINDLIDQLCTSSNLTPNDIYLLTIVGNTSMTHLLVKLDPTYLAQEPFVPVTNKNMVLEARDLDLHAAHHAQVHVLPNIAGFLGSDTVGVVLATKMHQDNGITMAIDIGTNGEIVLACRGEMLACSTAAGPAFEGVQIECGMRAAVGAIEKVVIAEDVEVKTIGGQAPRGICGSGLVDAVADMIKAGIVKPSGKIISPDEAGFLPEQLRVRLGNGKNGAFFVLAFANETSIVEPMLITQTDIRQLQLAKGAIYAGAQVLMAECGIAACNLDKLLLAGAFGNYLNKESALSIGLLPPVFIDKIENVGNAAGIGSQLALLSKKLREDASQIALRIKHIELSTHSDFQNLFITALNF